MKIHLGCGRRFIDGFVHVDTQDYPHIDHRHDVRRLPFFADGGAELIYASHVLEYFDRQEAAAVLQEWRRVLRGGGVLRLAVPDFAALSLAYNKGEALERLLGPLYGRMLSGTEASIYHKTAYDFASLEALLLESGFQQIRRYDWRETIHKDYDDFSQAYLPHMDKQNGLLISLNIEALKA